jgi:hypothetical protein
MEKAKLSKGENCIRCDNRQYFENALCEYSSEFCAAMEVNKQACGYFSLKNFQGAIKK